MKQQFSPQSSHLARISYGWLILLIAVLAVMAQTPQAPAPSRTILMKQDVSGFPNHEAVVVRVEFPVGSKEPKHTHPGDVFAYVQSGSIILNVEGKPTVTVKQGETFFVPAGVVHWGENAGKTPTTALVTFVVEKGKPLTSPAQ